MLKDNEVKDMALELEKLLENLEYNVKSIPLSKVLDKMGFPPNWMDIIEIDKKVF